MTPSTLSAALSAAMPGDILLLGAGSYPAFTVSRSGSAGQPIVIRGESVDTVTIGGRVTMNDRQYVHLENVTVMGEVRMNGASNMVVRGCRIRTTAGGITFQIGNAVPRNNTIVDNDVVGGATWVDDQLSADGYNGGEGIQFTGSGHVICFNHVANFRDDISFMEYDEAFEQTSIDICNNDIEQATDDAIEADSAMGNVRVFRNRIRNCFDGISAQPNLGGPTYYVRNVMYNVLYTPFKFHNGTVGDVVVHNTAVKCGDALGIYAGETWQRRAVPQQRLHRRDGRRHLRRLRQRQRADLRHARRRHQLFVRLRRPRFDRDEHVPGTHRRGHVQQLRDADREHHRGARGDGRPGHLREPARVPGEPVSAQAGRRSPPGGGQRGRRQGRRDPGPRRRLRGQRARSRRVRAGRAAADLRPAHRRRRHRHRRRGGRRSGRRGGAGRAGRAAGGTGGGSSDGRRRGRRDPGGGGLRDGGGASGGTGASRRAAAAARARGDADARGCGALLAVAAVAVAHVDAASGRRLRLPRLAGRADAAERGMASGLPAVGARSAAGVSPRPGR